MKNITDEWEALAETVDSLPEGNNGNPFYGDLVVRVLKNKQINVTFANRGDITKSNDPYNEENLNNPFIYEGINSTNDYRDFLTKKFNKHKMKFENCITKPYNFDMPLDAYTTTAKVKRTREEIKVYIKFGIHKNSANLELEFENVSFHPSRKTNPNQESQ